MNTKLIWIIGLFVLGLGAGSYLFRSCGNDDSPSDYVEVATSQQVELITDLKLQVDSIKSLQINVQSQMDEIKIKMQEIDLKNQELEKSAKHYYNRYKQRLTSLKNEISKQVKKEKEILQESEDFDF